jgi:hypothetical protein
MANGRNKAGGHDGTPNLVPMNRRTELEQKRIASAGGKASGEARRRKANFKKTINLLLTVPIDDPTWAPILQSMGVDPTLESAVMMAMVMESLKGGLSGVKAAEFLAKYSGQDTSTKTSKKKARKEAELINAKIEEIKAKTAAVKAGTPSADPEEESDDGFIEALQDTAEDDWADGDEAPGEGSGDEE